MLRENAQNRQQVTHGGVTLKIYEVNRGNRRVFSVAHKKNGRRQLKQFGDLAEALSWASSRAKDIDSGTVPSVMLRPDEGAIYRQAMEILREIGKPLDLIAREYAHAVGTLGGRACLEEAALFYAERHLRLLQNTVPEIVEELLTARAHKSDRHVRDLKQRLRRFARDFTGHIDHVTQSEISNWLAKLGLGSRSHDNYRQALVLLFRFAQRRAYLPDGKTTAEKTIRRPVDSTKSPGPASTDSATMRATNLGRFSNAAQLWPDLDHNIEDITAGAGRLPQVVTSMARVQGEYPSDPEFKSR